MDRIIISGLKLESLVGTIAWERKLRQTVILDLEIDVDAKLAATSDKLPDTLDYAAVAQRLAEFVAASEFQLIEALAEACARMIISEFEASRVQLVLHKPGAVRNAADVALRIERSRSDYA